jgi:hypothetical protein
MPFRKQVKLIVKCISMCFCGENSVRSEIRCALRLRYVELVVSIEVAVEV